MQPSKKTNIAMHFIILQKVYLRGLVIVISDLMDDSSKIINGLRHLRHKGHEVIVFHIIDRNESTFNFNERVKFIDNETAEEITTDPWHIAKDYIQLFDNFCQTLKGDVGKIA